MSRDPSTHVELADHLVRLVTSRLLDPLSIVLQSDTAVESLRERVSRDAETWSEELLGRDETRAVQVATRLLAALYPGDAPFAPPDDWWRTPLGRVVARRIGHPAADRLSFAEAGAMLGITRQGVHDLVSRDRLQRHPEGGVRSASIRARLNQLAADSPNPGGTSA